jgi:hypothetical protein
MHHEANEQGKQCNEGFSICHHNCKIIDNIPTLQTFLKKYFPCCRVHHGKWAVRQNSPFQDLLIAVK